MFEKKKYLSTITPEEILNHYEDYYNFGYVGSGTNDFIYNKIYRADTIEELFDMLYDNDIIGHESGELEKYFQEVKGDLHLCITEMLNEEELIQFIVDNSIHYQCKVFKKNDIKTKE